MERGFTKPYALADGEEPHIARKRVEIPAVAQRMASLLLPANSLNNTLVLINKSSTSGEPFEDVGREVLLTVEPVFGPMSLVRLRVPCTPVAPLRFLRLLSGAPARPAIPPSGISFTDARSGLRFEAYRPDDAPTLWKLYLDGAEVSYRAYGVECALGRAQIEDGKSTALFWVIWNSANEIVGGCRVNGPLASAADAHALWEMRSHNRLDFIEQLLDERVPFGVVEVKAAWLLPSYAGDRGASDALARAYVHSMLLANARYCMCTGADHVLMRWQSSGARPVPGLAAVPYPDDRYRTVLLWWDRESLKELASPSQWEALQVEEAELARRDVLDLTSAERTPVHC